MYKKYNRFKIKIKKGEKEKREKRKKKEKMLKKNKGKLHNTAKGQYRGRGLKQ